MTITFKAHSAIPKPTRIENKSIAQALFDDGDYERCIDFVNSIYGWRKGELDVSYTREQAKWCITQL